MSTYAPELAPAYADAFSEYQAARQGAVLLENSQTGRLLISGTDRLAFLQRMTTNELLTLKPGQGTVTVLTAATAKIIDVLTVYARESDLLTLTTPGNGERIARHLRGFIFWQDQVTVKNVTADLGQLSVYGPQAADAVQGVCGVVATELAPFGWRATTFEGNDLIVARAEPVGVPGFHLIAARAALPVLWEKLQQMGVQPCGREAFELLRVEAGVAGAGHEITDAVTPLEAGLHSAVSFSKGCYTGQEIIARQTTYDKVMRHLVGLLPQQPVAAHAQVLVAGRPVGTVTSAITSPALHKPIALAYVHRSQSEPGNMVTVRTSEGEVQAQVVVLPFVK